MQLDSIQRSQGQSFALHYMRLCELPVPICGSRTVAERCQAGPSIAAGAARPQVWGNGTCHTAGGSQLKNISGLHTSLLIATRQPQRTRLAPLYAFAFQEAFYH